MSLKNAGTKSKSIRISLKKFQDKQQQNKNTSQAQQSKYQYSEHLLDHLQYHYNTSEINKLSQDFFIKTNQAIQSFKSMYLFQKLIQQLTQSISNQFERQNLSQLKTIITVFMDDLKGCLNEAKEMKEKNLEDNYTIKQSFNNRVQNYLCLLYGLQIKQKKAEIQRKYNYKDYVSKYLKLHVSKLQLLIDQNASLIPERIVKEKLNPIYSKVDQQNNEKLLQNQKRLDETLKNVLKECRRIKKQSDMKSEIERMAIIEKTQKANKQLSLKYKNLAGILINPFTYFERDK